MTRARCLGIFMWALAFFACAPLDTIVVDLPLDADGGRPRPEPPCVDSSDCAQGNFCEKMSCEAPVGRCRPRPVACTGEAAPSCGCNGVNYWNDCLRRAQGIAAHVDGECTSPAACAGPGSSACPDSDAVCGLLLPPGAPCGAPPTGVCWLLPATCPSSVAGATAWQACGPPGPGALCTDLCSALRTGTPHRRANTCL